jgi:hypothetical protein
VPVLAALSLPWGPWWVGGLLIVGAPIGAGTAGLLLEYLRPAGAAMALAGLLAAGGAYALSHGALRRAEWPTPLRCFS